MSIELGGKMPTYRESISDQIAAGEFSLPPLYQLFGLEVVSIEDDRAVMAMTTTTEQQNSQGSVQGGVLYLFADAAMDYAWGSRLEQGSRYASIEMKINFLKAISSGPIQVVAEVVHRGRTLGLVQCDISDATGRLLTRLTSTFINLPV
jgi:uncharacterized protein (TIGR00369 family)